MCIITREGNRAVMDCVRCGLGLGTPQCINSHLKALEGIDFTPNTMRYEEEIITRLDEKQTKILIDYIKLLRKIETDTANPKFYGMPEDDFYLQRKEFIRKLIEELYLDPLLAYSALDAYKEGYPERSIFMDAHQKFVAWISQTKDKISKLKFYKLVQQKGDIQKVFLSILRLTGMNYLCTAMLPLPSGANKIDEYPVDNNITVEVYEVPKTEAYLYVQNNKIIGSLNDKQKDLLMDKIRWALREMPVEGDVRTIFDDKIRELRMIFLDAAAEQGINIDNNIATAMARETASWVIGLGSAIENIARDKNVTDVFIDSQNAPIYLEHNKYGICHTLWRYDKEMIERMFSNIVLSTEQEREFDEKHPIFDTMLRRLNMRCHLQRPPATFNDYQAALRLMRTQPFTYPLYLKLRSMTPFFAGYDDVMVNLGSSEGVLGLKSSGKTSFVSAKIAAIGTKKRIIPLQDIEEIPVTAYRKRGFHIGAVRVQPSEKETVGGRELDLVTMANASLRMGDACVIINEIRSRLAIQGVINLLNTQPGVFLLYNLHAQSLRDVQDRLELVFGIPGTSMFSTDRYTVLKKLRFGRKTRIFRVIDKQYEADSENHKFDEVFAFKRGPDIDKCHLICNFITNKEASAWNLDKLDMAKLQDTLKFSHVPPILKKRCEETGLTPKQAILQAFFKAKMYDDIYRLSEEYNDPQLLELDFVLKCNTVANSLLREMEDEEGNIDYSKLMPTWNKEFERIFNEDRKARGLGNK